MARLLSFLLVFFTAGLLSTANAQNQDLSRLPAPVKTKSSPEVLPAANDIHTLTQEDLSSFMDGLLPFTMQREDTAGIVVLVVKDGRVLYSKGFG